MTRSSFLNHYSIVHNNFLVFFINFTMYKIVVYSFILKGIRRKFLAFFFWLHTLCMLKPWSKAYTCWPLRLMCTSVSSLSPKTNFSLKIRVLNYWYHTLLLWKSISLSIDLLFTLYILIQQNIQQEVILYHTTYNWHNCKNEWIGNK